MTMTIDSPAPSIGRATGIGALLGFLLLTSAIAIGGTLGGLEAISALGLGVFVGAFGGAGFGAMMGAVLCLARHEDFGITTTTGGPARDTGPRTRQE